MSRYRINWPLLWLGLSLVLSATMSWFDPLFNRLFHLDGRGLFSPGGWAICMSGAALSRIAMTYGFGRTPTDAEMKALEQNVTALDRMACRPLVCIARVGTAVSVISLAVGFVSRHVAWNAIALTSAAVPVLVWLGVWTMRAAIREQPQPAGLTGEKDDKAIQ